IEEAEIDWYSQALEAAEKKLRHIKGDQYAQQARLYRFLTYRGFSSEIISKVSQTLLPELAK
ncbi:MAG: RecX family transcriptional regulator, partial [Oleibacter sp.]|nr:RecX family transcriptional regulator [Thalassolituus sp.]